MTTHTPLPVAGYKPQSQDAINLVNANKVLEEKSLRALDALKGREDVDGRWLAIGRTQLEQAWMAINRAVFQPQRIVLSDDTSAPADKDGPLE